MEESMQTRRLCLAVSMSLVIGSTPAIADEHHHSRAGENLGKVSFSNSCKPEAQESFQRAVAMLHSCRKR
jgi:hypothetical protein